MSNEIDVSLLDGDRFTASVTEEGYELHIDEGEQFAAIVFAEGLEGPRGLQGEQGEPGAAGAAFDYIHEQDVPSAAWVVVHNLNGFPNVTTVDTLDREFIGETQYDSPNQLTVIFAIAVTGRAFLS